MAQLSKFCKTILEFSANSILLAVLFAFNPALGVVGDPNIVKIPPSAFHYLDDFEMPTSPITIQLKGNKVDLSSLFQILEQIKKSPHNDVSDIMEVVYGFSREASDLCRTLSEEDSLKCKIEIWETMDNVKKEISERIAYPNWYSRNKLKLQASKEDALDSDCTLDCTNSFRESARTVILGSQTEYFRLYNKIKNRNKSCQNNIMRNLDYQLYRGIPKKCLKRENKSHPVCKEMRDYVNTVRDRIGQLSELAYGPDVLKNTEAQMPCAECTINGESEYPLVDFFNTLNEQSQCLELNPGEEKRVSPGTGLDQYGSYTIQREPDGAYSVALNLEFSPDEDYDGAVPKERAPEYYLKKTQRCIRKANEGMLGPNGKRLRIAIKRPLKTDACDAANKITIGIGSKDMRSSGSKYASDISCSTIIHEVLHLLGLCDEYKEQTRGVYTNPKTGETFDRNSEGKILNSKGEKIEDLNLSDYDFKPAADCRVTHANSIMSSSYRIWSDFVRGKRSSSLLTPGQFNSILYGECPGKNKLFNECSQLAYRDSGMSHLIINGSVVEDCTEMKKKCESQNVQGLNKQEEIEKLKRIIKPHERMLNYLNERADFIRNGGKVPDSSPIPRLMPSDDPESEPFMRVINRPLPLLAKREDSSDSESELLTMVIEVLPPLAKREDSSDSVKAGTSKNPQNAKRTSLDYRHQRRLDSLNFDIEFQNKVVDNLKRKLKRVEAWPD